jgi:septal ring factor EnvC (AmiA/AmiB activator)
MKDNPLGDVEYMAFLNMWLCRFVFCGKANEPTLNHITMAIHLARLQASYDLKIARKAALEAELRSLSAEIEADKEKIAELAGLIEKTQAEEKSAITKIEQCDAELTNLSGAQKDCQELLDRFHQATSNARGVITKHLNI